MKNQNHSRGEEVTEYKKNKRPGYLPQEGWPGVLSVFSGAILLILAFPPFPLGFLAYVSLVPLLFITDGLGFRKAFLWGYLYGVIWFLGTLYWIGLLDSVDTVKTVFAVIGALGAILVLAGFFALKIAVVRWSEKYLGGRALWLLPFVWAAIEYGRSFDQLAFPWIALGNTQTFYQGLVQFADVTSVFGVSAWIVLVNLIIYRIIGQWGRRKVWKKAVAVYLALLVVSFLLPFVYSQWVINRPLKGREVRVALCQGNFDIETKWARNKLNYNIKVYEDLSRKAAEERVDLIVWPETATPTYLLNYRHRRNRMHRLVDELGIPILTGTPYDIKGSDYGHNSAVLFRPEQTDVTLYHKMHPVPFSERVPLDNFIPFLRNVNYGESDWEPGTEYTIFDFGKGTFCVLICFESVFPDLVRQFIRRGAELILVITNDAWFRQSSSPYQHARIAVMRAIEHKVSVARCANTGISMIIDPFGRVKQKTTFNTRDLIVSDILLRRSDTFYARHGNIFGQGCLLVLAVMLMACLGMRRRRTESIPFCSNGMQ